MKNSIIYFCSLIYFAYLCNTETNKKFNPLIFTDMKNFRTLFWNYSDIIMAYICLVCCFVLVQIFSTFNDITGVEKWVFGLRFTLFILAYLNTVKLFLQKNELI